MTAKLPCWEIDCFFDKFPGSYSELLYCHYLCDVKIGVYDYIQVDSNGDIYYISKRTLEDGYDNCDFYFKCIRKDLVEVNGVVDGFKLKEIKMTSISN